MSEKLTYFITFVLILLFTTSNSYSSKIKILYKIENEIITNYDIAIEKNYLIALNNNLQKLPKNQLESFVKESMIREKIKKIELEKFNIVLQDDKFLDQVIKDLYGSLNFQNLNDFENTYRNIK